ISMRDLQDRRLQALAQESLQLRGMRDGVRAFFLEMQTSAKSSAEIVYDSLNSAVDRVSANMAKLLTGRKTEWAEAFKDIGESMVQDTTKSAIQRGLGALGKKLGIDIGSSKPDGTAQNPIWVRMAGGGPIPAIAGGGGGTLDLGGLFGG